MVQSDREQAPANHQHGMSYLRNSAVDNQVDKKQKAKERGDDQRSGNGLSSLPGGGTPQTQRKNTIGETVRHLLSVTAAYSYWSYS